MCIEWTWPLPRRWPASAELLLLPRRRAKQAQLLESIEKMQQEREQLIGDLEVEEAEQTGAGGRFRFAGWSVVRLGCGGNGVKTNLFYWLIVDL